MRKRRLTTYFLPEHLDALRFLSSETAVAFSSILAEIIDAWLVKTMKTKTLVKPHSTFFWFNGKTAQQMVKEAKK